jgi:hypothetical protein
MARASLIFWVLLFVVAPVLWAQSISDLGVTRETAEFEGHVTCTQNVANLSSRLALSFAFVEMDQSPIIALVISRFDLDGDDLVYGMFFEPDSEDEILFRFANTDIDDVVRFGLVDLDTRLDDNLNYKQIAAISVDESFLERLVSGTDDVRFRLSAGDSTKYDDTLLVDHLQPFRAFIDECLP